MEVLLASSSEDGGISCWDLRTGGQLLLHKSCASSLHGLTCVGQRLIASSQLGQRSSSGTVFYWSWDRPQVEVKSFPAEPIGPLIANSEGTYLFGGGASGEIYMWEVTTGKLLKHWRGHLRAVTCMALSDDDSILISGADGGEVRVWSLYYIFEDALKQAAEQLYMYSLTNHSKKVTDVVIGCGGYNTIFVTASEDKTCKVWCLSTGIPLRSFVFPSEINAIVLDPGEHVFYAGGKDGEIYIAALHEESSSKGDYGMHIMGTISVNSKCISSLAYSTEQNLLICGSKDGTIQACDTQGHVVRTFRHTTANVNNVAVVRTHQLAPESRVSHKKRWLPPPLEKYANSTDDDRDVKVVVALQDVPGACNKLTYISSSVTSQQIEELKQQGSVTAMEAELERQKLDLEKSMQYNLKWKQMFGNLHEFCVNEIVDTSRVTRG